MAVRTNLGLTIAVAALVLVVARAQQSRGGEVDWPQQWVAFGPVDKYGVPAQEALTTVPEELVIDGERLQPREVWFYNNLVDLGPYFGGKESGKTVYLFARLQVEQDTELRIGTGADWRMQWWVDGRLMLDTVQTGNQVAPVHMSNHTFTVSLPPGEHVLAVRVISGSHSFVFAAGLPDQQEAPDAEFAFPEDWTAFGPVALAPGAITNGSVDRAALLGANALATVPDELHVDGERLAGRRVSFSNNRLDLGDLFDGPQRGKAVYLLSTVSVDTDTKAWIGAGANWWMQWWLDGRPVYDTLNKGNQRSSADLADHVFKVAMSEGEHALAVCVLSGESGFSLAAGGPRALARQSLMKIAASEYVRARHRDLLDTRRLAPQQEARARLAIAQTYLDEADYAAAQREYASVLDMPGAAQIQKAQAHLGLATVHAEQFDEASAGHELRAVLAMDEDLAAHKEEARRRLQSIDLVQRLRPDHPRLFLNRDMWPGMRDRALGEGRAAYRNMQDIVDGLPPVDTMEVKNWGPQLPAAAFAYRVTRDRDLLAKVTRMLEAGLDYYEDIFAECESQSDLWAYGDMRYSHTRIAWLAALDWVWNDLTPAQRRALASRMLDHVYEQLTRWPHFRNWQGSFYLMDNLYWYAGVVLADEELGEEDYHRALEILEKGYGTHLKMMHSRAEQRTDDGALAVRFGYTAAAYPHADWSFVHTWRSAISPDIPKAWHHTALMPNQLYWNFLPGLHYFGLSFAWHNPAYIRPESWGRPIGGYLAQHVYFYSESHPEMANLARYLWQRYDLSRNGKYGAVPIWSEIWAPADMDAPPARLPEGMPLARHFDGNGTVHMRTGGGPADTYALFNMSGTKYSSGQFDVGHFGIYKQGWLALDTGTRNAWPETQEYYSQTVAHNCVLIRMPGEEFKGMFGKPAQSNAGGQRHTKRADPLAFETDRHFAYAATDATDAYHPDKCAQMVRQFLFLAPDHFVVFDRVTSTNAEYPKTWLLHTSNEPTVTGSTFRADQAEGRLFCRTLSPPEARLEKIGGPGKEFWADGRNWPLEDRWWEKYGRGLNKQVPEMMGRWRVEVRPGAAREQDYFLHLIQVSNQSVEEMVDSSVREVGDRIELTFSADGRTYTIALNKTGAVGGHIRIEEDGAMLVNRPLTQRIMPQAGLALEE